MTIEGDGVVVGQGARVLEAEHGIRIQLRRPGPVGELRLGWLHGEASIEAGQGVGQPLVGLLEGDGPGSPKLLDHAILQGAEEPLDATPGLRRVGLEEFDPQFVH